MQVPGEIVTEIESALNASVSAFHFVQGGCINHGGKLVTNAGIFFLKWNDAKRFPHMFSTERQGLELLAQSRSFRIPRVNYTGSTQDHQFILMEFIETSRRSSSYWQRFGEQLAIMHRCAGANFGLDHDNYIGSLPQRNTRCDSWVDFFIMQRLQPQLVLCEKKNGTHDLRRRFDRLFLKLNALLVTESPALLHGDLWSGNVMVDNAGQPCLIDPAVYYGNREVDIAMTRLFGGFDKTFVEAYDTVFPLQPGLEERVDLYNLYPLLVHVNLFGDSYLPQVISILKRFV